MIVLKNQFVCVKNDMCYHFTIKIIFCASLSLAYKHSRCVHLVC